MFHPAGQIGGLAQQSLHLRLRIVAVQHPFIQLKSAQLKARKVRDGLRQSLCILNAAAAAAPAGHAQLNQHVQRLPPFAEKADSARALARLSMQQINSAAR